MGRMSSRPGPSRASLLIAAAASVVAAALLTVFLAGSSGRQEVGVQARAPLPPPEQPQPQPEPEASGVPDAGRTSGAAPSSGKSAGAEDRERAERLRGLIAKLGPLQKELGQPGPSDWLANHREPGQTFEQYLACVPTRPTGRRNTLHVEPLGEFTATQRRIVDLTAEFMGIYFNVPAKVGEGLSLDLVPAEARRKHPSWGMDQVLSTYVLENVLFPRLPKDAAAYIAFTSVDLWPGEDWNFVFGQASDDRVGVWSLYRFGDPDKSEDDFRLVLLRTLKLATHETGHMFSAAHCTAWQCNMNGCNTQGESDRHPLALCPECMAKVCWAARAEPAARYRKLIEFCKREGLKPQAEAYEELLKAVEGR